MHPSRLQDLFREYAALERRRTGEGITPLEYHRWQDLKQTLTAQFSTPPPGGDRRGSVRVPTRIRVEFRTQNQLRRAFIRNMSRGGLFINTPFALEIGSDFVLRIEIRSTGELVDVPCTVVSNDVGDGFTTTRLGMGVAFRELSPEQRKQLDELCCPDLSAEASGQDPP